MGSSYGSLHVQVGPEGADHTLSSVTAAIQTWMTDRGYRPSTASGWSRAVLLAADSGDRWISVYDSEIDQLDEDQLRGLGIALSGATDSPVVGASVFDSDIATMWLFHRGRQIDALVDRPEFLEELTGSPVDDVGDASRWELVLPSGVAPEAFDRAARGDAGPDDVFAEDRVASAFKLLGIDEGRATVGFRYAEQDGEIRVRTRLQFEGGRPSGPTLDPGLAELGLVILGQDAIETGTGRFDLTLSVANYGRRVRGIAIVAEGEALSRGLIELDDIVPAGAEMVQFLGLDVAATPAPFERVDEGTSVARLGGVELGLDPGAEPGAALSGQMFEQLVMATVPIRIAGRATRAGAGTLRLMALSLADLDDETATSDLVTPWEVRVSVR
jgi:hypothetical protein